MNFPGLGVSGSISDFLTAGVWADLVSDDSSRLVFFRGLDGFSSSALFLFFGGLLDDEALVGLSRSWSFRLSCKYERH